MLLRKKCYLRPSTKRSTTRNRSCFCYYVTSTSAIFFNFQVKRDGRESNRATNLSPPPRLKMTEIKQTQQTTKKSKVYIILPSFPPPRQTFPPKKKVQSSLVQELVQKMFTKERKCKRDHNNSANAILSDSVLVK